MADQVQILDLAKKHAEKMKVAVDDTRAKCVDGGYRENEAVGALAIAGAHVGISMALIKLGYSAQEAFDLVYDFLEEQNKPYCWHTDTHEGHEGVVVGCGHWNASIHHDNQYDLEQSEVRELLKIVRQAQEDEGYDLECVELDREHAEEAILVVVDTDFTVKPWDQDEDTQFFIYDVERHDELLQEFADQAEIDYKQLKAASDEQTNATLGLLGSSQGKPMIEVSFSGEEAQVSYLGEAPVIES